MFRYTKALCRAIPKSIVNDGLSLMPREIPVDYALAVKQHDQMIDALKKLNIEVTILEADESTPDCVFTEDTAVAIDNTVLITNPGAASRKAEVIPVKKHFQETAPNMHLVEMLEPACMDGGDVMFTGREIFVGLSSRTNKAGYECLRDAFPKYPTHAVEIENDTLHLKSMMTMVDEDIILCGKSSDACKAIDIVMQKSQFMYSVVRTPDDSGANVVVLNGTIFCRSDLPDSLKVLEKLSIPKIALAAGELSKVDGCLTCCSVLYN